MCLIHTKTIANVHYSYQKWSEQATGESFGEYFCETQKLPKDHEIVCMKDDEAFVAACIWLQDWMDEHDV